MSFRCLQCDYTLDGLEPQHDAVLCPECGLRQFPGDRERRERRRESRFMAATFMPWPLPVALILTVGWTSVEWVQSVLGLLLLFTPIVSAILSLAALLSDRSPRLTPYQWLAYPLVWVVATVGGFVACLATISMFMQFTPP